MKSGRKTDLSAAPADSTNERPTIPLTLYESIPVPVWHADDAGNMVFVNAAWLSITGQAIQDELSDGWMRSIHQDDLGRVKAEWHEAISRRLSIEMAFRKKTADQAWTWMFMTGGPTEDPLQSRGGYLGVCQRFHGESGTAPQQMDLANSKGSRLADSPMAISYFESSELRVRYSNEQYRQMFGAGGRPIHGKTVCEILGPTQFQQIRPFIDLVLKGEAVTYERMHVDKLGNSTAVEAHIIPHMNHSGTVLGGVVLIRDITKFKLAEKRAMESQSRLRSFVSASSEGILFLKKGKIVDWNRVATDLLQLGSDLAGRSLSDFIAPDSLDIFRNHFTKRHKKPLEVSLRQMSGNMVPVEIITKHAKENGKALQIAVIRDLSDRKLAEERFNHLAYHDELTQLPNRSLFRNRMETELGRAARGKTRLAVAFLDLDLFKTVNDSLGHQVGDKLLKVVSARLVHSVRETDSVARLGGDEFAVLLPDIDTAADVSTIVEKISRNIGERLVLEGQEISVSVSVGVAIYPEDGTSAEELLRNSDAAMYLAKEKGRGNCQFFTQKLNTMALEELSVESGLRAALADGGFELYYQPQLSMEKHEVVGLEALIRWHHPVQGLLNPGKFISVAERRGLIGRIGHWVLVEACRQIRDWREDGWPAVPVAINVSALQFRNPHFVEQVSEALWSNGLSGDCLELEVTETVLMEDVPNRTRILNEIRDLGVRIAIDDFGTGYSSLSYLRTFRFDRLKIDQSFVREIPANTDDIAMARTIINMAKNLKIGVIAEGVETGEQFSSLKELGCEEMQGFYYSGPVPSSKIPGLIHGKAEVLR